MNTVVFDLVIPFWESVLEKSSKMGIKIYIPEFSMLFIIANTKNKK